MNKLTIAGVLILVVIAGWFVIQNIQNKTTVPIGEGTLVLVSQNNFDFGEIRMNGGEVQHNYTIKNTGTGPVTITDAKTSCMCTSATIFNADGVSVGVFGMGTPPHGTNPKIDLVIPAGGEITVEATYDPLAHGPDATGALVRDIFITTSAGQELDLKFRGVGVKKFTTVNGPSLAFNNTQYDFGSTNQSQGVFTTTFNVVNNGTETVVIDSLPASCECVSARIDKKTIPAGGTAIITVAFDANLHQEPNGRFFKTITVNSNSISSSELKIFANVNYDRGLDTLKLQTHEGGGTSALKDHTKETVQTDIQPTYKSISAGTLSGMLQNKDFVMIDVHTPEQKHIPGTDYMISYDEIGKIVSTLKNKDSKVVLYCRSGSMSKIAAKALVEKGYANVYELKNGFNEWKREGNRTLPKGSIPKI